MSKKGQEILRNYRTSKPIEELERKYNKAKGRYCSDKLCTERADLMNAQVKKVIADEKAATKGLPLPGDGIVTIIINGTEFKLPRGETNPPEIGHNYFSIDPDWAFGIGTYTWAGTIDDRHRLKNKAVHLSYDNAHKWVRLFDFLAGGAG